MIGAAGLIGRAVLTEARRTGTANAVVASASAAVPDAHVLRLSAAAVDPLARLLEQLEPPAIINASGRTAGDADELWQANVEPVATILEAMGWPRPALVSSISGRPLSTRRRQRARPTRRPR